MKTQSPFGTTANDQVTAEDEVFFDAAFQELQNNPDAEVDWEDKIIEKLVGKEKCLHSHLNDANNDFINDLLKNFKGDSSEFGINIESEQNVFITDENGNQVEVSGLTRFTSSSNMILIKISSSQANSNKALQVVKTKLHEYIHSEIYRRIYTSSPTQDDLVFKNSYESYEDTKFEPSPQHQTMADFYVNLMAGTLRDFHQQIMTGDYNYMSNNGTINLDDFYEALAWQGLKENGVQAWIDLPQGRKDELDLALNQFFHATTFNCPQ